MLEAIENINEFIENDLDDSSSFILVVDENPHRKTMLVTTTRSMFNRRRPIARLIEPPFQAESRYYQTLQAAIVKGRLFLPSQAAPIFAGE